MVGFTGAVAAILDGHTIHAYFNLPITTDRMLDLTGDALEEFQEKLKSVWLIIFDEYSMIGI